MKILSFLVFFFMLIIKARRVTDFDDIIDNEFRNLK